MAIRPGAVQQPYVIETHLSTTNQSFLDMHYYLKSIGIQNNAFHLALLNPRLAGVNPRDPRLSQELKALVLRECLNNIWYFLREVVVIPDQGGDISSGVRYKLHRGNLALTYGFMLNINMFLELPRQNFKSISSVAQYLWIFNFGTTNSEIMFMNKKHDDSKTNLTRLKDLRRVLPSYLRMDGEWATDSTGKKLKVVDRAESLSHPTNGNVIKAMASARNEVSANSLGRGLTQPLQWYDEYAFIPYIGIIYLSATPAFNTAAGNAKRNNAPHGILITTTPGDLRTSEGKEAFDTKNNATKFEERFYDLSIGELRELLSKNTKSPFVYMRFTYQQLGRDEEWFKKICVDMKGDWSAIRREVLLEWSAVSDNSPFSKEDLNIVGTMIAKGPVTQLTLANYYTMDIYKTNTNLSYPPIIGVDVAGGFSKDASSIVVIDSKTTEVIGVFNNNYISIEDFAVVIYELVTKFMPNAVVNIERNGGFGASVIDKLMRTEIKRNLYSEIKDKVIEESFYRGRIKSKTQKTKVYGFDTTKESRNGLMEILRERMSYHKDKFVSPIIYNELQGLEVKRSGRIEHSADSRDDTVMAYLLALYVWYDGKNVNELYGIVKESIRSDAEYEFGLEGMTLEDRLIINDMGTGNSALDDLIKHQANLLNDNTMLYDDYRRKAYAKEVEMHEDQMINNPGYRKAYAQKYNLNEDNMTSAVRQTVKLPDNIFDSLYTDENDDPFNLNKLIM